MNYLIRKLFLTMAGITIVSCLSYSQVPAFEKGANVFGFAIGIGGTYYSNYTSSSPLFHFTYEKAMSFDVGDGTLGFGGLAGYKSTRYKRWYPTNHNYYYDWKVNYYILGFRSAYHYDIFKVSNLDTYGGLMLSYNIINVKDHSDLYFEYNNNLHSELSLSAFVGARYYFNENWGVHTELGLGMSILTLGVNYRP